MPKFQASRRTLIKGLGAATAISAIGMPAILRAAEPVKIGFLAPLTGDEALLGITWFAQDALGELVHFEAPSEGSSTAKDVSYGEVESVKAVSELISPLSGTVIEVNAKVVAEPETVNEDPYGDGWLVRISLATRAGTLTLLAELTDEQLASKIPGAPWSDGTVGGIMAAHAGHARMHRHWAEEGTPVD